MIRLAALPPPPARRVLGVRIDATSYPDAAARVCRWAAAGESRVVCAANVHMVMEAREDPAFAAVLEEADLATPDGMPLVWALRRLGVPGAERVYGPDLALAVCARAAREGIAVGLFGGTPEALAGTEAFLRRRFPRLEIVFRESPPFRPPTAAERAATRYAVHAAGARILFVALGCPRQERWMAAERGRLRAVMIGIGAAFDFFSGRVPQAPPALRRAGLEWAFRLGAEPRRLWRRYLRHNPRFAWLLARQLARGEGRGEASRGAEPERAAAPPLRVMVGNGVRRWWEPAEEEETEP